MPKMKFLGPRFQKLQPKQDRQTRPNVLPRRISYANRFSLPYANTTPHLQVEIKTDYSVRNPGKYPRVRKDSPGKMQQWYFVIRCDSIIRKRC